jgi:hypothetical protein
LIAKLWAIAALSVEDGLLVAIGLQGNTSSLIGGARGRENQAASSESPPRLLVQDRLRIGSNKYRKHRIFANEPELVLANANV